MQWKPFREQVRLLFQIGEGYCRVLPENFRGNGGAIGSIHWDIPTGLIPRHLRANGSRFLVVGQLVWLDEGDSIEEAHDPVRFFKVEEISLAPTPPPTLEPPAPRAVLPPLRTRRKRGQAPTKVSKLSLVFSRKGWLLANLLGLLFLGVWFWTNGYPRMGRWYLDPELPFSVELTNRGCFGENTVRVDGKGRVKLTNRERAPDGGNMIIRKMNLAPRAMPRLRESINRNAILGPRRDSREIGGGNLELVLHIRQGEYVRRIICSYPYPEEIEAFVMDLHQVLAEERLGQVEWE